eukprot:TRINITY_DN14691_c0_g1_i3.p1 TRINITY_DN14691_c0_g1~~TRINITY_DN14691_c0_g1_i3.p1  ORF type:complete len:292 (-),score=50.82 TRINITY_DN14691_c0_g1_i3:35-910(-)
MSRDMRTRRAGADEASAPGALSVEDDSGKGKDSNFAGVALFIGILMLGFVLPFAWFLLYSWQPASSQSASTAISIDEDGQEFRTLADTTRKNNLRQVEEETVQSLSSVEVSEPLAEASPVAGATLRPTLVQCNTTAGRIKIAVHWEWSPHGAARFLEMVQSGFFTSKVALFRAVRDFICQTGIAGDPEVHKQWERKGKITDDPQWLDLSAPNRMKRGYLSFAGGGPNSRGTEFFFSFRDINLGTTAWEVPFGTLIGQESFQTMDLWYTGYGDLKVFGGRAPEQSLMYRDLS